MPSLIPLTSLFAGQRAVVQSIVGSTELVRHLQEVGIREGVLLEMIRSGAPSILQVDGSKLCLRGDELLRVMVQPLTAERCAG